MQLPSRHFLALSALLACGPTLSVVAAAGIQPSWFGRDAHPERDDGYVFPFLKRLRNSAVEFVFGPPSSNGRAKVTWTDAASVHARYQHDVVVRFNVTNPGEEASLSAAAFQMLLDVWAFTPEYVDIRMNKHLVSKLLKILPSSLQPAVLIQDVAAAALATFPSKSAPLSQFDPSASSRSRAKVLADGADNIFFSNYQPLIVSSS